MEPISALKQYGLDDREAALYLACLELGPSLVWRIARKANIKRTTVYLVAESLKQKGLLSEFRNKHGINYVAEPPEYLIENLKMRQQRIQGIIPELRALSNREITKPRITFYEGKEGIREVCDDSLRKENTEVLFMSSLVDIYKIISPNYDSEHYIPARLNNKIKIRMLVSRNLYTEALAKKDEDELRETRFLPKEFRFTASQFIYQNKIAYVSSERELVGAIIESVDIAELERQKYEMIWNWLGSNKAV